MKEAKSSVYIIANGAPKSGKTTTTLNLGLCFATLMQPTLIIDLGTESWMKNVFGIKSDQLITAHPFLDYMNWQSASFPNLEAYKQVVINCPCHQLDKIKQVLPEESEVIIPVETEYYGLNTLGIFLQDLNAKSMSVKGFLPVMHRPDSDIALAILKKIKSEFQEFVFLPVIQRNYYLARQKDLVQFDFVSLTEKAATTHLGIANQLL